MAATPVSATAIASAVHRLAEELRPLFRDDTPTFLVGIANGGLGLTNLLAQELGLGGPTGLVNAVFHRDDIGLKPIPKNFQPTELNFDIDGARIVLVDDVFASGRTVRAALNELFDHGRPAEVRLAVLIDTRQPRLPLRPDFVGLDWQPPSRQKVQLHLDPSPSRAHSLELLSL